MAMTARQRPWLLPLAVLLGYLLGWASVTLDRQMLISEQGELRREVARVRVQLKLRELTGAFDFDWQQMVIWNEEAKAPPKKVGK
ncbi:unnamed protein product [marine sediment metagenome]|uniref:Uncharacterized protein n=1 Tax=marine sediment metagenome TaxID=412755 RepID=X1G0Y5_9ZZZZ